jgi:3-oxoacyl-[acyl-carrier protein] reductase
LGAVSVLVCCAGYIGTGQPELDEIKDEDWDRCFAVNVSGVFYALREYFRRRKKKPVQDGRIIIISSLAAHRGTTRPDYASSKGAVLTLMKSAARKGAPLGITANGIAPGAIDTPYFRSFQDAQGIDMLKNLVPLGRIGKPEEIAALISFLASPEAGYITGVTIDVDGGILMR